MGNTRKKMAVRWRTWVCLPLSNKSVYSVTLFMLPLQLFPIHPPQIDLFSKVRRNFRKKLNPEKPQSLLKRNSFDRLPKYPKLCLIVEHTKDVSFRTLCTFVKNKFLFK